MFMSLVWNGIVLSHERLLRLKFTSHLKWNAYILALNKYTGKIVGPLCRFRKYLSHAGRALSIQVSSSQKWSIDFVPGLVLPNSLSLPPHFPSNSLFFSLPAPLSLALCEFKIVHTTTSMKKYSLTSDIRFFTSFSLLHRSSYWRWFDALQSFILPGLVLFYKEQVRFFIGLMFLWIWFWVYAF